MINADLGFILSLQVESEGVTMDQKINKSQKDWKYELLLLSENSLWVSLSHLSSIDNRY